VMPADPHGFLISKTFHHINQDFLPMPRIVLVGLLSLVFAHAWAARPLVTDDARLTTAGSCQLESWTRIYSDSQEVWALPACNPTGNLEFTAGGGRAIYDQAETSVDYVLQLKTLFRPLRTNDWGVGLGVGSVLHPEIYPGPNQLGNAYAYVPVSISFDDDNLVVHTNLGWLRDRATGQESMTFGIGGEFQLASRFLAIAEVYGDERNLPFWQIGGRYSVIPDMVQVDATVGQQSGGSLGSRWISMGLRFTPERLF
jgi:hypothetical protein